MVKFNAFEKAIDFTFWKEICEEYGRHINIKRGEYFVHADQTLKKVGWILSGGFKHSLPMPDGSAKTVGFVFHNTVLANYESIMLSKKMQTDIIAIANSEVIVAPAEIMRERFMYDPTLHTQLLQALFSQSYEVNLNFYRHTPEERFALLLKSCPEITSLVSYNEIASYLNISRRQFHRIRENI